MISSSHVQTWELSHKEAERQRIDAFKLWCWRRLLRVPWTARRSNQSTLKENNPEYSLERLILKLQYFGHLMRRADSLEKPLMLGDIEGRKRMGQQRMRWLDVASLTQPSWISANSGDSEGQGSLTCCSPWGHKESDLTEWLNSNNKRHNFWWLLRFLSTST